MNKKKKIYLWFLLSVAIIYVVLLVLLFLLESADGDSTIRTLGDAFWYSLVTLSTVGYGDVAPVTPLGRAIGVLFLFLSTGLLVTLFGTVVSFLTGEALLLFFLRLLRQKNWYYFADYGPEANILAGNIVKEDKDAVIIYGEKRSERSELPEYPCIFLNTSPARIIALKKNAGTRCKVFLMKENDIGVNTRAVNLAFLPVVVYARTTNGKDSLSGNIRFFHSYDCCARQYWHSHPLCSSEQNVVLIGFGSYGQSLLERAILTNVISADQHVTYHIFGDAKEFLEIHNCLGMLFSINKEASKGDVLMFHSEFWGTHHDILEKADRIIVCTDDEQEGWDIYWKIQCFYRSRGRIDLRSNRRVPGISYFGTNDEIYTPSLIMQTKLNEAAIAINELFRKSVSYKTLSWEELDDFHRQSKIAAADHLLVKIRILLCDETITEFGVEEIDRAYRRYRETKDREADREMYRQIDHIRWCRFYNYYNWTYGPKKDEEKREHPMLRPYGELSGEQKAERDAAWELMNNISMVYKHFVK